MCLPVNAVNNGEGIVLSKAKNDGHTEKVFVKNWAVPSVKKSLSNAVNLGRSSIKVGRYVVRTGNRFVSVKDTKEGSIVFIEFASLGALLTSL